MLVDADYSLEFDTSITEDDMERSMREVLPAESLRQKIKRSNSQSELPDYSSDEVTRSVESPGNVASPYITAADTIHETANAKFYVCICVCVDTLSQCLLRENQTQMFFSSVVSKETTYDTFCVAIAKGVIGFCVK